MSPCGSMQYAPIVFGKNGALTASVSVPPPDAQTAAPPPEQIGGGGGGGGRRASGLFHPSAKTKIGAVAKSEMSEPNETERMALSYHHSRRSDQIAVFFLEW